MKSENEYLLIGGAPKCGTTSLFRYLADHPEACPSSRKETYFFAREYDHKKVCQVGGTAADFETYFSHCSSSSRLRIEGTPYTLYSKGAAQKIAALLPGASVLFILRDPTERLISDYKFQKQRGHPATTGSIQDFFKWQNSMKGNVQSLVEQGCYIRSLQEFIDVLGRERVIILFFENLVSDPVNELRRLSIHFGLDDSFYSTYEFDVHNPTGNSRSSFLNRSYMRLEPVVANMRAYLMNRPKLYKVFEQAVDHGKSAYRLINDRKSKKENSFPRESLLEVTEFYRPYNKMLSDELGIPLPWKMAEGLEFTSGLG